MNKLNIENLKCCGNCTHFSISNVCTLNSKNCACSWTVCKDWEYDNYTTKTRIQDLCRD